MGEVVTMRAAQFALLRRQGADDPAEGFLGGEAGAARHSTGRR